MGKLCKLRHDHADYYRCEVCGRMIRCSDPSTIFATCSGKPRKFPPLHKQAVHYAKAVAEHVASGMQTRTDEEVINLLQICETCEEYQDGRCLQCGCRVSSDKNAFANKLRMKTEKCPRGLWE